MALGGLTSSLTRGGLDVVGISNVRITNGRACTVTTVCSYTEQIIKDFGMDKEKITIAIVGAAGSIGSGCALELEKIGVKNFLLIDTEKRSADLKNIMESLDIVKKNLVIEISHQIQDVRYADIIIAATNAPEAVMKAEDFSPGSIIINDAQPSDVHPEVYNRDDILVVEGGVVHTPGISCNFNMGLADKYDNFSCLGEALILSYHQEYLDYSIGFLDHELIGDIRMKAADTNISISSYQNIYGYISHDQISKVKEIIHNK